MSIDGDSFICPITQEVFRDPVIAEDGRLYEREAITRWINEHGTSPFTRQVLDVNYLQPDDEVRKRADQRRRLSVSYNRESDQVQLPPIRSSTNTADHLNNTVHPHPSTIVQKPLYCLRKNCQTICFIWLIIIAIIIATVASTSLLVSKNEHPISALVRLYLFYTFHSFTVCISLHEFLIMSNNSPIKSFKSH